MTNRSASGFTLIELMIVVAVVAILATIAYPAYQEQIRKSRRAEAISALQDLQLRQERWRVDHSTFAASGDLGTMPAASNYAIAVDGTPTGTYYKLSATPNSTSQQKDSCGTLTVESTSGVISKKAKGAVNSSCW